MCTCSSGGCLGASCTCVCHGDRPRPRVILVSSEKTMTGIPIEDCTSCGGRHPVTRKHCEVCGAASLFPHAVHSGGGDGEREGSEQGVVAA